MRTYCYARISRDNQEFDQQMNTVNSWLNKNNLKIDVLASDDGISGSKSYKVRKLNDLLKEMQPNDMLIVSELPRLGRSMADISKLINEELKPRKLRLVIVSMGIDLNCAEMRAQDELLLANFSFAAQVELEMIRGRTKSGLAAKKARGEETGGTEKLWGKSLNMTEEERKEYRMNNLEKANRKSAKAKREKALNNPNNKLFWDKWTIYNLRNPSEKVNYNELASFLNKEGVRMHNGNEFDYFSAGNTLRRLKRMYN